MRNNQFTIITCNTKTVSNVPLADVWAQHQTFSANWRWQHLWSFKGQNHKKRQICRAEGAGRSKKKGVGRKEQAEGSQANTVGPGH